MNEVKSAIRLKTSLAFLLVLAVCASAAPFMHGQSNSSATGLNFIQAAGQETLAALADSEAPGAFNGTDVARPVFRLGGDSGLTEVTLPNSLMSVDDILANSGKTLRIFLLMKGENIDAAGSLWSGAPAVKLELFDAYGNCVATGESLFKTRGTFPWHGYYVDIAIPKSLQMTTAKGKGGAEEAASDDGLGGLLGNLLGGGDGASTTRGAGLYMTLSCTGGGTVWFASPAYQSLGLDSAAKTAFNGSYAPNDEYDELPMMLFYGLPTDSQDAYAFLKGNKAQKSLLSAKDMAAYVKENSTDWFHLQNGIANLPFLYNNAPKTFKFDDGWMDALAEAIESFQDPETGFWMTNGQPDLMATAAIVNGCYAPTCVPHKDITVDTPSTSMGENHALKYGEQIIGTLLAARVEGKPVWNAYAFKGENVGGSDGKSRGDLMATAAAVQLLARAAATLGEGNAAAVQAEAAIAQAWKYALRHFLSDDGKGLWKDNDQTSVISAAGRGFLELAEGTPVLEERVNAALPRPAVEGTVAFDDPTQISVRWPKPEKELSSVRIYYAPKPARGVKTISGRFLVGVLEKKTALWSEDPYVMLRKISLAAHRQWGVSADKVGANYIDIKLKSLPSKLPVVLAGKALLKTGAPQDIAAEAEDMGFYAAGVNAYGEMTPVFSLSGEALEDDEPAEEETSEEEDSAEDETSEEEDSAEEDSEAAE